MKNELSPAAQAVLDAWDSVLDPDPDGLTYLTHDPEREALAAALRAAADQVVPSEPHAPDTPDYPDDVTIGPFYRWSERRDVRHQLLAIAAELDGH